jgi:3-hydroxy-3-methylglutaryl CoA synthase
MALAVERRDVRTKAVPKTDENALTMATEAARRVHVVTEQPREDVATIAFASMIIRK